MIKKEKGITLIVLIVTIVVLLILTGVSINLGFGNNGIIGIAKEETNRYSQTVTNDQIELKELENLLKSERVNWENSGTGDGNGGNTEENIDRLPPNSFTPTATSTTNSITLEGSTTDNGDSGIRAYYFSINDGEWVGGTLETSYTFTGLTQSTMYELKMKAVDNAGNETITEKISKETVSVPTLILNSNTTISYNPATWTNGDVSVTITTTVAGYTLQYSLDAKSWTNYTSAVTMTSNGPIYARVVDGTGQAARDYATGNVTKIDKLPPNNFTPTATSTTSSITLTGSTTDNGGSGIKAYYFSINNGSWVGGTTTTSYTFTGLTAGTTYSLKMKAVDNATNEVITSAISKATLTETPKFSYTGKYEIVNDDDTPYTSGNKNWKIRFLTSGTLKFTDLSGAANGIDVFLVGGGGGRWRCRYRQRCLGWRRWRRIHKNFKRSDH